MEAAAHASATRAVDTTDAAAEDIEKVAHATGQAGVQVRNKWEPSRKGNRGAAASMRWLKGEKDASGTQKVHHNMGVFGAGHQGRVQGHRGCGA